MSREREDVSLGQRHSQGLSVHKSMLRNSSPGDAYSLRGDGPDKNLHHCDLCAYVEVVNMDEDTTLTSLNRYLEIVCCKMVPLISEMPRQSGLHFKSERCLDRRHVPERDQIYLRGAANEPTQLNMKVPIVCVTQEICRALAAVPFVGLVFGPSCPKAGLGRYYRDSPGLANYTFVLQKNLPSIKEHFGTSFTTIKIGANFLSKPSER